MTIADPDHMGWQERAACAGMDTRLFFSTNPDKAQKICGGCPVRAECLYDALEHERPYHRHGVRGGLTAKQRHTLPALEGPEVEDIAALRELLATQHKDQPPPERTDPPMSGTPTANAAPTATPPAPAAAEDSEKLPIGQLLKWGDEHPDPEVQDQAARARAALLGLRKRHAADQELTEITTEAEQLEKRLAELRAREQELAPAKPKKKRGSYVRDYDTREVRAWADANGVDCPRVGQIPKRVLDAWRAAGKGATTEGKPAQG